MKVVILAGGGGTRLWPYSREKKPKQVLPVIGRGTLLQNTYKRLRIGFKPEDIFIVTGESHKRHVKRQIPSIPKDNIFAEPARRDSAGAIGLAASRIHAQNPKEILISAHADSWIDDDKKFIKQLLGLEGIVKKYPDHSVLLGIKPSYPETGLGYIQLNKKIVHQKKQMVYSVRRFIEKPNLIKARKLIKNGGCLWNIGWFAWRVDYLMSLYREFLPKNFSILKRIAEAPRRSLHSVIRNEFSKLEPISIDYGIFEKTKNLLVMQIDAAWSDIGHWRSVAEMSQKDQDCNVVAGESVLLDSANNLFISESGKFIASIGVENIAMIETQDVILLIDKDRAQDVKYIVERLKKTGMKKYL